MRPNGVSVRPTPETIRSDPLLNSPGSQTILTKSFRRETAHCTHDRELMLDRAGIDDVIVCCSGRIACWIADGGTGVTLVKAR
jgi:hypothetical protein